MYSDDEILNIIAGPIDAPASWRYQFWIAAIFGCFTVAVLESDGKGTYAYLWVLSRAQCREVVLQENLPLLISNGFDLQLACEVPKPISNQWRDWPLAHVGDVFPGGRDGIGMTMRSFNGSASWCADLSNPDKVSEPLQWQAREEIFEMLDQLFRWKSILANSYEEERKIR